MLIVGMWCNGGWCRVRPWGGSGPGCRRGRAPDLQFLSVKCNVYPYAMYSMYLGNKLNERKNMKTLNEEILNKDIE